MKTEHTEIRLLSELQRIQPGKSFWLALQLKPESGWHTYWKNPGDAGKATFVEWSLPAGMHASELHWPYPQRIRTGPLVSFGYTGNISLLTEISPALPLHDSIEISAKADWLVCKEICIPESAVLTLSLPVSHAGEVDLAAAPIFKSARMLLPIKADWTARYLYKGNELVFDIPLPATAGLETMLFFPVEDTLIENSSSQSFLLGKSVVRVSMGAGYIQQSGPFHGVLVIKRSNNATAEALEFTAHPVEQLPDPEFETKPATIHD